MLNDNYVLLPEDGPEKKEDFLKRSPLDKYTDGFKADIEEGRYGTRFCDCRYWLKGIKEVNDPIALVEEQNPFYEFDDRFVFRYCPWCGNKLKRQK